MTNLPKINNKKGKMMLEPKNNQPFSHPVYEKAYPLPVIFLPATVNYC